MSQKSKMGSVIPTIFSTSKKDFISRFEKLRKISHALQIDFMDGKFVKSKSIPISQVPSLKRLSNNFEAHLMVLNPENYIRKLKGKGFKKVIFHLESLERDKAISLITRIKREKLICFIAINPETYFKRIIPYLKYTDGILFMGVYPGKEHQSFINSVYKKIKELRKIDKEIIIQVDGGVNDKTIKKLARIGVDYVNSGSYISETENPKQAFKNLSELFKKYKKR